MLVAFQKVLFEMVLVHPVYVCLEGTNFNDEKSLKKTNVKHCLLNSLRNQNYWKKYFSINTNCSLTKELPNQENDEEKYHRT